MHSMYRLMCFRVCNLDLIKILKSLAEQVPDFVMLQHVTILAQGNTGNSHGAHC